MEAPTIPDWIVCRLFHCWDDASSMLQVAISHPYVSCVEGCPTLPVLEIHQSSSLSKGLEHLEGCHSANRRDSAASAIPP